MSLLNKIDFAVIIGVHNANPNGDPLNGNRPRQTSERLGEISDVCLKRKIRNRLLAMGEEIYVQSDDNRIDECRSLKERFDKSNIKIEDIRKDASQKWFDVRAFGQVFALKETKGKKDSDVEGQNSSSGVSVGIRGPVTIQSAFSLRQIVPESLQITKSTNLETDKKNPDKKGADTMGMKHRVSEAIYVAYGAISPQLASKTGFSASDAEKIKLALRSLYEGDDSSARPAGSMEIIAVIWCQHDSSCGQFSSATVHRTLKESISRDGQIERERMKEKLPNLDIQVLKQLEGEELAQLMTMP